MTATRKRRTNEEHQRAILSAALIDARGGLAAVTLRGVARRCNISHKQVALSFGTVDALREAVAAEAVRVGDGDVIGRLVIDKHRVVDAMPVVDRQRYVAALAD